MINFHFGENLRVIRTTKGISQKAMAHQLEISQPTYSRLESSKNVPEPNIVSEIAKVLGVPKVVLLPRSRLTYKAKAILESPFGVLFILVCFCSLGPGFWGLTDAICKHTGVPEETAIIYRKSSIIATIILIWYSVSKVKRGGKYVE